MGSCVSKQHESNRALNPFTVSQECSDTCLDQASDFEFFDEELSSIDESRTLVDASLLSCLITEDANTKHRAREGSHRKFSTCWNDRSLPLAEYSDNAMQLWNARLFDLRSGRCDDPLNSPRRRYSESGELSVFSAENYFKGSQPFPLPSSHNLGNSQSLHRSDSSSQRTFSLSESLRTFSSSNMLAADNADPCSSKRMNGEFSVTISAKAPLSSVFWQMRHPGRGVSRSFGDGGSSLSSLEFQAVLASDKLYKTKSRGKADGQVDFWPFDHFDSGDNVVFPEKSISFRRIFAPSLVSIPYLDDAPCCPKDHARKKW